DTRLGGINWQLKPSDLEAQGFTQAQVDKLFDSVKTTGNGYRILPYVMTEAAVVAESSRVTQVKEGQKQEEAKSEQALNSLLLIGFPLDAAAELEPDRKEIWNKGLGVDE